MADKEVVAEVKPEDAEKAAQELNDKVVAGVENILNPPDEEVVEAVKEEAKVDDKQVESEKEDSEKEVVKEEDKSTQEEDKAKSTDKLAELNLPNRVIQAAKRNHLTEDEIVAIAEKSPEVLAKMADTCDAVSERLGKLGQEAKKNQKPVEKTEGQPTPTLDPDESGDSKNWAVVQNFMSAQEERIAKLQKQIEAKEEIVAKENVASVTKTIDSFFDAQSDFPEFGKSDKLSNAELVMRQNVWEKANDIIVGASTNGEQVTIEDALTQSMSIYEAKSPKGKKVSREQVLSEVKEREKNLISRSRSKKIADHTKTGDEQAVTAVKKFFQERGNDGW